MLRGLINNISTINNNITNINNHINSQFITNIVTLTEYKDICSFNIVPNLDMEVNINKCSMYEFSGKTKIPHNYELVTILPIDVSGATFETVSYYINIDNTLNIFLCCMLRYTEKYKPDISYFGDIRVQIIYKKKNFLVISGIIYSPLIKY